MAMSVMFSRAKVAHGILSFLCGIGDLVKKLNAALG